MLAVDLTVNELATFVILLGGVVGSLTVVLKVIVGGLDHRIKDHLDDAVEPLRRELKPNGGKSLRDDVAAIRSTVEGAERTAADVAEELRRHEGEQRRRHEDNRRRFGRIERAHAGLRHGVLWLFEADRRAAAEGDRPDMSRVLGPPPTHELERIEEEYRVERDRDIRPDHPIE